MPQRAAKTTLGWISSIAWVVAALGVGVFIAGPMLGVLLAIGAIFLKEYLERDLIEKRLATDLAVLEEDALA